MEYLVSRWQDYHPILVGAGCLALGYIYGRHCKSIVENHYTHNIPMELDATCNYIVGDATIEPKEMIRIQGFVNSPTNSILKHVDRSIDVTPSRIHKRTLNQLEIFQMPRKNEDTLWIQSRAFKKQKGVPTITIQRKESLVQSNLEPTYDSDDEILAKRLEFFTNQSAFIHKPSISNRVLKLDKKKKKKIKSTIEMSTISFKGKDLVTIDKQKSLSKTSTRSRSGLCDLANLQGECSLEDTFRSPKTTMCLEDSIQVEETNSTHTMVVMEQTPLLSTLALELGYNVNNPTGHYIEDRNVDFMESQYKLHECANKLTHTLDEQNQEEKLENTRIDEGIVCKEDDTMEMKNLEDKMSTSQPRDFHVKDKCLIKVGQEVVKEHKVPMDKVLKVEIYEMLHTTDCSKVSFQEIVSVLEEKLKVVLQEDKAHIVSLVREVINISKFLEEEEKTFGISKQVEEDFNVYF